VLKISTYSFHLYPKMNSHLGEIEHVICQHQNVLTSLFNLLIKEEPKSHLDMEKLEDLSQKLSSISSITDKITSQSMESSNSLYYTPEQLKTTLSCLKYEVKALKTKELEKENDLSSIYDEIYQMKKDVTQQKKLWSDFYININTLIPYNEMLADSSYPDALEEVRDQFAQNVQLLVESVLPPCSKPSQKDLAIEDNQRQLKAEHKDEGFAQAMLELERSVKCLKYEVKQLKQQQIQSKDQDREFQQEIENLRKLNFQGEQKDQQTDTNKTTENIKEDISEISSQLSDHSSSIRCIKYELKKLQKKIQEAPDDKFKLSRYDDVRTELNGDNQENELISSFQTEIQKSKTRIEQNESQIDIINNHDNLIDQHISSIDSSIQNFEQNNQIYQRELKCLKFEVKKMKEELSNSTPIFDKFDNCTNRISSLEDSFNIIKNDFEEVNQQNGRTFHCLKHALKSLLVKINKEELKEQHKQEQDPTLQTHKVPSSEEEKEEIVSVKSKVSELYRMMRCLKYEIKQLKEWKNNEFANRREAEELTGLPEINATSNLSDDKCLTNIENQINKLVKDNIEKDKTIADIRNVIKCLKHELLNTKAQTKNLTTSLKEGFESVRQDIEGLNIIEPTKPEEKRLEELKNELKCLKYEIKKLKERSTDKEPGNNIHGDYITTTSAQEREIEILAENKHIEDEIKMLKNQLNSILSNTNQDQDSMNESLRCLKHEIKLLKQQFQYTQIPSRADEHLDNLANTIQQLKDNYQTKFQSQEQQIEEINNKQKDQHQLINNVLQLIEKSNLNETDNLDSIKQQFKESLSELLQKELEGRKTPTNEQEEILPQDQSADSGISGSLQESQLQTAGQQTPILNLSEKDYRKDAIELKETLDILKKELEDSKSKLIEVNANMKEDLEALEKKIFDKINNLSSERSNFENNLRCFKHEIKLLKSRASTEVPTNDDSLQEVIDSQHKTDELLSSLTDKVHQHDDLWKEMLESINKLTNGTNQEEEEVRSEFKSSLEKLLGREHSEEQNNQPMTDQEGHHHQIVDIIELPNALRELQTEIEELQPRPEEKVTTEEQSHKEEDEAINDLQERMNKQDNELKCLKYEIKKLKERPIIDNVIPANIEEREAEVPSEVPHNDDDRLSELEESLRCLKHEIKLLKSRPISAIPTERSSETAPVERVSQELNAIKSIVDSNNAELNEQKEAQELLKSEIESLKAQLKEEQDKSNKGTEELPISPTNNEDDRFESIEESLRCLKHEIKLLKSQANSGSTTSPIENSTETPTETEPEPTPLTQEPVSSEDIESLKSEIETLKNQLTETQINISKEQESLMEEGRTLSSRVNSIEEQEVQEIERMNDEINKLKNLIENNKEELKNELEQLSRENKEELNQIKHDFNNNNDQNKDFEQKNKEELNQIKHDFNNNNDQNKDFEQKNKEELNQIKHDFNNNNDQNKDFEQKNKEELNQIKHDFNNNNDQNKDFEQ
ncbi:hypothetical protein M9Y10_039596, partial [Tritrichomonas musculus]